MPEWCKTPAEANNNTNQVMVQPLLAAAVKVRDLVTKPLKSGNADIEAAPMMQKKVVSGIDL